MSGTFRLFEPGNFLLPDGSTPGLPGEAGAPDFNALIDLGDTLTFVGTGATVDVAITDPDGSIPAGDPDRFDEGESDQILANDVTVPWVGGGTTFAAGQQCTPLYVLEFEDAEANTYRLFAFQFDQNVNDVIHGAVFLGPPPPPGTVLTVTANLNSTSTNTGQPDWYGPLYDDMFLCFAAGTMIATPGGPRPVEALRPGDPLCVVGGPPLPVRWQRVWHADVRNAPPIRIASGALGDGRPDRPLLVSPPHRLLIRSRAAARLFGATEVLVAARFLTGLPGIGPASGVGDVTYVHVLLDRHAIVTANGAPAETLLLGPQARRMLDEDALDDIAGRCPDLWAASATPCRPILTARQAGRLTARMARPAPARMAPAA
jgi:hypothetical protein